MTKKLKKQLPSKLSPPLPFFFESGLRTRNNQKTAMYLTREERLRITQKAPRKVVKTQFFFILIKNYIYARTIYTSFACT